MIQALISVTTKDKDLRQDLWVAYLSGEIDSTFSKKLQQLSILKDIEKRIPNNFQDIIDLNIPQDILDQLSDIQCSILFMTILGYSLEQVGRYNGVRQVIVDKEKESLSKHPVWEQYGIKETLKPRPKIRPNRRRDKDIRKISEKA